MVGHATSAQAYDNYFCGYVITSGSYCDDPGGSQALYYDSASYPGAGNIQSLCAWIGITKTCTPNTTYSAVIACGQGSPINGTGKVQEFDNGASHTINGHATNTYKVYC